MDGAICHINNSGEEFREAVRATGLDIRIRRQPPNSPDLNVLDLGYFKSIQSLQYTEAPTNLDQLVNAVRASFDAVSSDTLNKVFLTHQECMIAIMQANGGNDYPLPHMHKDHLNRVGELPLALECDLELVLETKHDTHLQQVL